ncbi:prolyl 3-hydroxylase 1-like isoform X2 [Crassostrea virginica]
MHSIIFVAFVVTVRALEEDPTTTYYRLYRDGTEFYTQKNFSFAKTLLEKSLEDYRFYHKNAINCRVECRRKNSLLLENFEDSRKSTDILEIGLFENFIHQSKCMKRCFKKVFGERPDHIHSSESKRIDKDFETGRVYQYLQFCYYELKEYTKAACAAYTYYLKHPHDQNAQRNVQMYREKMEVKDEEFVDLDRKSYQEFHIQGENAYYEGNWSGVVDNFERALSEFYREEQNCRLQCEGNLIIPSPPPPGDFFHYLKELYVPILRCQVDCEYKLSRVFADHQEDFIEEHYNFLQYAYYQMGDFERAAQAIGAFLLFNSSHREMLQNRLFFMTRLGYHDSHLSARKEAVQYIEMRNRLESLLYFAESNDLNKIEGDSKEVEHYLKEFEKLGIKLIQTPSDLKGRRFVAEGVLRDEQQEELLNLMKATKMKSAGIQTTSIPKAIQAVKTDPDLEISLRLLLKLSEAVRFYTSKFLNQTSFYTKETKVICRGPPDPEDKEAESDCFPQEDGSCADLEQEHLEGDPDEFRAVLYINDVEKGGETVFLNRKNKALAHVFPKKGHFTVFEALDKHMVTPPSSQRCVILMTFSTEKVKDNPEYRQAMLFLNDLDEEKVRKLHVDNVRKVEELTREGVSIVQSGQELHGTERFVADGLITEGECQNLISLLERGGIEGDGYKGKAVTGHRKISPHTNHEIFEGLTVGRATQLVKSGNLPRDLVQLFLGASERARILVENFFNLTRPLYFDYTHLVCRKAVQEEENDRLDLSHPVHADNCLIQPDGSCLRQFPAYIARDYSAVLYLNEKPDFIGGEFFFAHGNKTEQISVSPKCGRVVGFNAGEYHGVRAVQRGRRCAIAMWYTMDPNTQELARFQAQKKMADQDDVRKETPESKNDGEFGTVLRKGEEKILHFQKDPVEKSLLNNKDSEINVVTETGESKRFQSEPILNKEQENADISGTDVMTGDKDTLQTNNHGEL